MERRKRRHFPASFKRQAVDRVSSSGSPIIRIAEEFGVHETALRRWIAQFSGARIDTPLGSSKRPEGPSQADLAAENASLKGELARAQMERDILKRAALIFGAASR